MSFWTSGLLCSALLNERASASRCSFSLATFRYHVGDIVCWSSDKEMVRTNTRRIIASMQNTQSVWDWPNGKFVGYAMSQQIPSILGTGTDKSVAIEIPHSIPQYTAIFRGLANVLLESVFQWNGLPAFLAVLRAEATATKSDLARISCEWKFALANFAYMDRSVL